MNEAGKVTLCHSGNFMPPAQWAVGPMSAEVLFWKTTLKSFLKDKQEILTFKLQNSLILKIDDSFKSTGQGKIK